MKAYRDLSECCQMSSHLDLQFVEALWKMIGTFLIMSALRSVFQYRL